MVSLLDLVPFLGYHSLLNLIKINDIVGKQRTAARTWNDKLSPFQMDIHFTFTFKRLK